VSPLPVTLALALALGDAHGLASDAKSEAKARIERLDLHLEAWDLEGAQAELTALSQVAPADSAPLAYYQGRVAFEEGRYPEALERLQVAGVSDRNDSWVRLVRDTQEVVGQHERVESEHFIFLFPKGKDAVLASFALEALERVRAALEQDLGYAPPGKVRVEVVTSGAQLSKVSTLSREAIRTTGTIAICKFNKLMVTSPRAVLRGYDWLDTLAHEYIHLVVSRKSRNTVPIWLHEGLARYLESRWRGPAGGAMTPSTLALLGTRVRKGTLVPFEKMHPSMALLPTAEDAATAFAEVYFAVQLLSQQGGPLALGRLLELMAKGATDKGAVEAVTRGSWADFERTWMARLKAQPYPKELIPPSGHEKKELVESGSQDGKAKKKGREVSFGDFGEVVEVDARRDAHLGELFRERRRMPAAAEAYQRAWRRVGDRYESVSNKYALTLLELKRYDEAEKVLDGSLTLHPGSPGTNVHLGRIRLRAHAWARARTAYLEALAVNPFDPEVWVGLYAAAAGVGDAPLQARALEGARVLLKVDAAGLKEVARRFAGSEDLAEVDLQAPSPDAG
jgi:tetratricopeptide (TPR) repeat protein